MRKLFAEMGLLIREAPLTFAITACAVVVTLLAPSLPPLQHWVADRSALREWWRLLTGTLVHTNLGHLGRDTVAFALLSGSYEPLFGRRWPILLLPALVLPPAAFLLLSPDMPAYYGLSGAVYALISVAFLVEWTQSKGKPPRWILTFCAFTLAKLLYEVLSGKLLIPMELGEGVVPAPSAHIVGLVVGAVCYPVLKARRALPRSAAAHPPTPSRGAGPIPFTVDPGS